MTITKIVEMKADRVKRIKAELEKASNKSSSVITSVILIDDNLQRINIKYFGTNTSRDMTESEVANLLESNPYLTESYENALNLFLSK